MREPSLYRRLRQTLSGFLFVLFHWREYNDIVLAIYQPWFDIVKGNMLYTSDPANWRRNWRCKFCGCRYSDNSYRGRPGRLKKHRDGCLWLRIKKIHPYYR